MPTTVTTYNTFVAGNKARASEMNANLDNHRGTLVPINSDTSTASDATHDLGQATHQWRDLYVSRNIYQAGSPVASVANVQSAYWPISAQCERATVNGHIQCAAFLADTDTGLCFNIPLSSYVTGNNVKVILKGYSNTTLSAVVRTETYLF